MNNTGTGYWTKILLKPFVLDDGGNISPYALFIFGMAAAILHIHLRWPLDIPGHHGLEWMTILLFARMQSRYRWAGLTIAGGAAMTCLVQVPLLPLTYTFKPALIYLLNGVCLDVLIRYTPQNLPLFIKGMVLGGICYMIKPALMMIIAVSSAISFGSFSKYGYFYPLLTHFLFGSIGGICGICLARLTIMQRREQ